MGANIKTNGCLAVKSFIKNGGAGYWGRFRVYDRAVRFLLFDPEAIPF